MARTRLLRAQAAREPLAFLLRLGLRRSGRLLRCGLFGSRRRAPWLLRRLKSVTGPGARILAASTDPYTTDNPDHLAYHARNRRRGRMAGQLRIRIRHGAYRTPWFDYLLASPQELAELADGTGWELTRVVGEGVPSYVGVLERLV